MTVRIAMWSCPRSLSTVLMRSWAQRTDTHVLDEPFYGPWLAERPSVHPSAAEILRTLDTDRARIAQRLRTARDKPIQYEKQITQHVSVPFVEEEMSGVRHAFLIRHPARQLTSLSKVLRSFTLEVSGWPMLGELSTAFGWGAPVVDADDLGRDPARVLRLLCTALSVEFSEKMLRWNAGPGPSEGAWAGEWYRSVQASTGYAAPGALPEVPDSLQAHYDAALPVYEKLYESRLR